MTRAPACSKTSRSRESSRRSVGFVPLVHKETGALEAPAPEERNSINPAAAQSATTPRPEPEPPPEEPKP
jgi:hypothetical protein